jgi:hypothetical protein
MTELVKQTDGLPPSEAFLHLLPVPLTERIPCMPCGATVDVAAPPAGVLGDMRRDATGTTAGDELPRVVQLVGTQRLHAQQCAFDRFRAMYNQGRPHQALGQERPASRYVPSTRSYDEHPVPIACPPQCEVRLVSHDSTIRWRNAGSSSRIRSAGRRSGSRRAATASGRSSSGPFTWDGSTVSCTCGAERACASERRPISSTVPPAPRAPRASGASAPSRPCCKPSPRNAL